MAFFVLIPGAGGAAWYWHRVVPFLKNAGHEVLAVDLPGSDERAGLPAYADLVVDAIGAAAARRNDVVVVAQSMGGFTAPLVCARLSPETLRALVFVNAMIPLPDETAGAWWDNTKSGEARNAAAEAGGYGTEFKLDTYFFHDVPSAVVEAGVEHAGDEAKAAFITPCRFDGWPKVPIHLVIGKDDRFFPAAFQERVARERLGSALTSVDTLSGGHLVALANPKGLADQLLAY
jgi:pimeloyl-ACP methyl ester carboxylesterase